ncbi:MAG: hypothetical protein HLX51_00435 [Micrococcaceae bacterium]|nr:hypothetical protein [Micrococcaceae bacterium]
MTQSFDLSPHLTNVGQPLVELEDFKSLPVGSVIFRLGESQNPEDTPEVFQRYNRSYWNLPGDDMMRPPYSDKELADLAYGFGTLYILAWRALDPEEGQ